MNRRAQMLMHHGIQGMKWGVRKYQNKDGTLTALGRRRLGASVNSDNIHAQVAKDNRNLSSGLGAASNASRNASNIASRAKMRKRSEAAEKIDLSKMSDDDLRSAINRMNLERQYKSLSTENIGKGSEYVSDILANAGDVIAIGASAASIAVAIHMIKSGG